MKLSRKFRFVLTFGMLFSGVMYIFSEFKITGSNQWTQENRQLYNKIYPIISEDQIFFPERMLQSQPASDTGDDSLYSSEITDDYTDSLPTTSKGYHYLLPVYRFGGGPNNQYRSFKIAVRFALHFNRSLVLGPFFNHPLIDKWEARDFNETFDSMQLSQLLKVATLDEFKQNCHGVIEKIVHGKPFIHKPKDFEYYVEKYKRTRRRFANATGIVLPGLGSIPHSTLGSAQRFQNATVSDCLAFYVPYTIDFKFMNLTAPLTAEAYYKTGKVIDEHVVRAPYIRQIADNFERQMCNGEPYVVVHWRINDEFMAMWCNVMKSVDCQLFQKLNSTGPQIATQLQKAVMNVPRLRCVYIAQPPASWDFVSHLRAINLTVFTSDDVLKRLGLNVLYEDNYVLSLVEQELASRAVMFIGSSGSSWTCFVRRERQLRDDKYSIFLSELLGFPATTCM
ncbi:uncharacterized protein LOC144441003 [Glandiceps talaboti]